MTTLPHTDSVECELHQGWLTVWFNQPERRNPLTDEVVADLQRICDALQDDRSIRGLTLRGRGGFFCAGGDLKGFKTMATASNDEVIAMSETIGRLLYALDRLPMVTIAVIEGAAMAGGLGVACCCDVTIGTADAKFAFSETRIGISPAQIARYVMHKCGESTGRRLMLSAARFAGEQAAALGILDVVVPDADGLEAAEAQIRADVLACAPGAVAATKTLIRTLPTLPDEHKMRFAAENFTDCLKGEEGVEGVASFLEKRKPNWHQAVSYTHLTLPTICSV